MSITNSSIYVFVNDYDEFVKQFEDILSPNGTPAAYSHYVTGFDLDCDNSKQITLIDAVHEKISTGNILPQTASVSADGAAYSRDMFLGLYGGLFSSVYFWV